MNRLVVSLGSLSVLVALVWLLSGPRSQKPSQAKSTPSATGQIVLEYDGQAITLRPTDDESAGIKTWAAALPGNALLIVTPTGQFADPGYYHAAAYAGKDLDLAARWQTKSELSEKTAELKPLPVLVQYFGGGAKRIDQWPDELRILRDSSNHRPGVR